MSSKQEHPTTAESVRAALGDMLNSPPPAIDSQGAVALMRDHYGIAAEATEIACERDANFHIRSSTGQEFILKLANPADAAIDINFQTEALLWLAERAPELPVPRVVRDLAGQDELRIELDDGRTSITRVLTWLDGIPAARVEISRELRVDMGHDLARLGAALRGFDHPATERRDILWNIADASRLRPLIQSLEEPDMRRLLSTELEHYETAVLPRLAGLRSQVIHNDLNLHNVVVDPSQGHRVAGILDFGDMVKAPLVVDLAVATSYHVQDGLAAACDIISAYHAVLPLEREEVMLLRELVFARLMTTVAITENRAILYPENAAYILRNNGPARAALAVLSALSRDEVNAEFLTACGMEQT